MVFAPCLPQAIAFAFEKFTHGGEFLQAIDTEVSEARAQFTPGGQHDDVNVIEDCQGLYGAHGLVFFGISIDKLQFFLISNCPAQAVDFNC